MSGYPPPVPMQQYGGGASPPPRPNGGFSYGMPPQPTAAAPPPQPQYGAPASPSGQYGARPPPPSGQYGAPPAPAPAAQYSAPPAQYGGPPAPSGQYGAPPGQYAAPPAQYAAPPTQYAAPPTQYAAPPGAYAAPPTQYATPPQQYGQPAYGAPPGMARPGLNPPTPYAPPALDASVSSKFTFQNNSLRGHEKNFTAAAGVSAEEVKSFFMFNAGPPDYKVKIIGWHMEKTLQKQQDGSEREVESRKNDWEVLVDPTKWLQCPGTISGIDDAIAGFLKSSKSLRKVTLHKRINFDVNGFLGEVKNICQKRGWRENTEAHIVWGSHSEKLAVHGASGCHNVCDSTVCKCLLFATCLCICWTPMKACCFEDHSTFYQDINLSISASEFAKAIHNDLPRSFSGYEAQINAQRKEEQREEREYEREVKEEKRREEQAEERREERAWEQEMRQEDTITVDYTVQEADGTVVEERETVRW